MVYRNISNEHREKDVLTFNLEKKQLLEVIDSMSDEVAFI